MKLEKKNLLPSIIPILLLFLVGTAWSETVEISPAKNTITRRLDHIVVTGKDLKENQNKSIPLMRLYAFRDGKMQPIPFQIDELTEKGDWVLPSKSPYLTEKQAGKSQLLHDDPPEVMDDNDELVFMITDIGDQADPAVWPTDWLYADELTLTDPLTKEQGWVYLLSFADPPEPSPVDYVEYRLPENKQDRIFTDFFTLGFSHEVPITQDYIDFNDGDNILDRMKIRIFFRFFYFIKFERTENDMASLLWQYKDGPVRVIRMIRSSIRLVGNLQSPQVNSETLYYRNANLIPMRIKSIKMPKGIVNEALFDSGTDYRSRYGWKIRMSSDERWLTVDGKMDEVEKNIKTAVADSTWYISKGPGRAQVIFLYFSEDYGLETEFSYLDDDLNEYPPEFEPGQVPYVGFKVIGLENITQYDMIRFWVIGFYINEEYSESELLRAMNIFNNPLEISSQGFTISKQGVPLADKP